MKCEIMIWTALAITSMQRRQENHENSGSSEHEGKTPGGKSMAKPIMKETWAIWQ